MEMIKPIAIPGDRWWPQKAKEEGVNIYIYIYSCNVRKERTERPNVGRCLY